MCDSRMSIVFGKHELNEHFIVQRAGEMALPSSANVIDECRCQ